LPANAAELSEELSQAEQMVRSQNRSSDERASWGRRQQRLYRHLAANEEWAERVLAEADPSAGLAIERNWAARRELSELTSTGALSANLPAWRIKAPLPPAELLGYYRAAEAATGIGWQYLAAINLVETRMGRIEGLSTAGATGPMQFLPSTWAECCEGDPTLDRDAILGAATYLVQRGGPANMDQALRGYNNSEYYVRAVSAYAEVLEAEPEAFHGYHAWEVFFRSEAGLVRLPVGYYETEAVEAAAWIESNPEHLLE
jgi:membrane-bound lytic murein transglycosylase B